MLRTHSCGELNISHVGKEVTLCGWVQRSRDLGGMTFIDLRDRYGITQLVFNMETDSALCQKARTIGREFVLKIYGKAVERSNKNLKIPTGEIEIIVDRLEVLNPSKTPPFTIEDESDGGEELRMQFRYLDLRRRPLKNNLELRHAITIETRKYLDSQNFLEIETPFLIKSTPEGARDFVVPSRVHQGQFYALPQSPQTFKQILMVAKTRSALTEARLATKLDPLSHKGMFQMGECLYRSGQFHEAIKLFDLVLTEKPYFQQASIFKGWCHYFIGETDVASQLFTNIPVSDEQTISFIGALALIHSSQDNTEKVEEYLDLLKSTKKTAGVYLNEYCFTLIFMALNKEDEMFAWLKKSLVTKTSTLLFIQSDPIWKKYYDHPEFRKLIDESFRKSIKGTYETSEEKYKKAGLHQDDIKKKVKQLKELMKVEEPFLDNELKLDQVAKMLQLSSNQLSLIINDYLEINFYDFVNAYRLEKFKKMMADPRNKSFTLLSIAFQCGFNSKTTFNTYFKKATGKTPSQYFK